MALTLHIRCYGFIHSVEEAKKYQTANNYTEEKNHIKYTLNSKWKLKISYT